MPPHSRRYRKSRGRTRCQLAVASDKEPRDSLYRILIIRRKLFSPDGLPTLGLSPLPVNALSLRSLPFGSCLVFLDARPVRDMLFASAPKLGILCGVAGSGTRPGRAALPGVRCAGRPEAFARGAPPGAGPLGTRLDDYDLPGVSRESDAHP